MPDDRSKVAISFTADREPYTIIKMYATMKGQKLPNALNDMVHYYAAVVQQKIKAHVEKEIEK